MARPKVAARWNLHILAYQTRFRADRTVARIKVSGAVAIRRDEHKSLRESRCIFA